MFKVENLFVEGKNLEKFLWALDGIVIGSPQFVPVRNAVAKKKGNGKVVTEKVPSDGESMSARLGKRILESKLTMLRNPDIKRMVTELGYQTSSTHYAVKNLLSQGLLARSGASQYSVNRKDS